MTVLPDTLSTISSRPALALWLGMIFYMLQIYLDFSAYSDMAIGMGQMIGFHYKENFDYPYVSTSVTEFWRRWHISLGTETTFIFPSAATERESSDRYSICLLSGV